MPRTVVIAIISAAVAVMVSTGTRQSFGLFLDPITLELGTGREVFGFAMALSNLIFGLPFIGFLVDRFGTRLVLMGGGVVYASGLLLSTVWTTSTGLIVSLGVIVGLGLGATTFVVLLGALGRLVAAEHRSKVFGLMTAMSSAGFLVMPIFNQWLIDTWSWKTAFLVGAGLVSCIILLAFGIPARKDQDGDSPLEEAHVPVWPRVSQGLQNPSFLLLIAGFFVCGFHVAFIGVHFPVFWSDHGVGHIRGLALAMIGTFNLVGSVGFGWLGDRLPRRYLLSFIYGVRGLLLLAYFMLPITVMSTLVFCCLMGLVWLATVPLTSGAVANFFGPRFLSTMYGFVFFSHQIGSFLGSWMAGRVYDQTNSYDPIFWICIGLGLFGFLVHFPIKENAIPLRLAPASATTS
jgi:MFS family permease